MDGCLSRSSSVQEWVVGTVRTLAKLYLAVPLPRGEAALFNPNPNPSPSPNPSPNPNPNPNPSPSPVSNPNPNPNQARRPSVRWLEYTLAPSSRRHVM